MTTTREQELKDEIVFLRKLFLKQHKITKTRTDLTNDLLELIDLLFIYNKYYKAYKEDNNTQSSYI